MDKFIIGTAVELLCESPDQSSFHLTTSSDEEEYQEEPPSQKSTVENGKTKNYVEFTVPGYKDNEFQEYFRMSRRITYKLIDRLEVSGRMATYACGRQNVTSEKAFLIALWYLGNHETFRQISIRFDVSYSTVYSMLRKVINFILSLRSEYIKWPTIDQYPSIADNFKQIGGIENVIGAIDGCHVKINSPLDNKNDYKNRRGFYSLLIQGVCTSDMKFTDVYCGEPGCLFDTIQLINSQLYKRANKNPEYFGEYFLLGDLAYPALNWLVPPFEDPEEDSHVTEQHREFNEKHYETRIVVENAFTLLKGRFRKLSGGFRNLDLKLVSECVMAACVLHNLCIVEDDDTEIEVPENYLEIDLQSETCDETDELYDTKRRDEVFDKFVEHL